MKFIQNIQTVYARKVVFFHNCVAIPPCMLCLEANPNSEVTTVIVYENNCNMYIAMFPTCWTEADWSFLSLAFS